MTYVRLTEEQRYQERVLCILRIHADLESDSELEVACGALVFQYPYHLLYCMHRIVWVMTQ